MDNFHKAVTIPRVQTDRRLIENIEGVDQGGANRGSKINPLQLTSRERSGLAV